MKNWFLCAWRHTTGQSLLLPILGLHLLTVLIVLPLGNFPLNDDWMYAQMVHTVLTEHSYAQHPFSAPMAVAHVLWGALFCAIFGFNYVTLRCSTLILGFLGSWATAKCVTECGGSRRAALLAAFTVSANPVFMNLSYTFMTDVPYYAVMALSTLFYLRALRSNSVPDVALGSVFCVIALFVRQLALSAGLAYFFAILYIRLRHKVRISPQTVVAFLGPWCVGAFGVIIWKHASGQVEASQLHFSPGPIVFRIVTLGIYTVVIISSMGLWLLPWTAARIPLSHSWLKATSLRRRLVAGTFMVVFSLTFMLLLRSPLPAPGNILNSLGTGAVTVTGTYLDGLGWSPVVVVAWSVATGLALVSAGVLMADMIVLDAFVPNKGNAKAHSEALLPQTAQRLFLQLLFVLALGASLSPLVPFVFDRYALALLLAVIVIGVGAFSSAHTARIHPLAMVAGLMLYLFSLAGVHDYLAWNDARWKSLEYLQNTVGVSAKKIDGGFEFNGIHTSLEFMDKHHVTDYMKCHRGLHWWVFDDTYTVSLSQQPGYRELKSFPFSSWIGWGNYRILALKRG